MMSSPGNSLLNQKVIRAWERYHTGDKTAIDDIYSDLLPFCLRVAAKTCSRYITLQDEEASIAQISILEAFEKYNPERGSFYPFLGQVIRNRIIDYRRQEKSRMGRLLNYEDTGVANQELVDSDFYETIIDDLARQQEIEQFKNILGQFHISFEDLYKASPRQSGTRTKARKAACLIARDQELNSCLMEKGLLPAKILEEKYNISHKILDKYRKYIIANVIILKYNFSYLKPYVIPEGKGE